MGSQTKRCQEKMKVVLDTNVLISAFLWSSIAKEIFLLAKEQRIIFCATQDILDEFELVLNYPKFKDRLVAIGKTPSDVISEFMAVVECYPDRESPDIHIAADPADEKFLGCALASRADYIISGDKHLLTLKEFRGIPIITPRQFLTRFELNR